MNLVLIIFFLMFYLSQTDGEIEDEYSDEIRKELLHMFGVEDKPLGSSIVTENSVSRFMKELYNHFYAESHDGAFPAFLNHSFDPHIVEHSKTVISIPNQRQHVFRQSDHVHNVLHFDLTQTATLQTLPHCVELRIYKDASTVTVARSSDFFTISLYKVVKATDKTKRSLQLFDMKKVESNFNGWLVFDVKAVFDSWSLDPGSNFGIHLVVESDADLKKEIEPEKVGIHGENSQSLVEPFIVAFYNEESGLKRSSKLNNIVSTIRKRRQASARKEHICQRFNLQVRFNTLGWDMYVLAPSEFNAFYCEGKCSFPLSSSMNATHHAIIQAFIKLEGNNDIPDVCCAGIKHKPVSVMHYNEYDSIVLKNYPNMAVEACGCQ
uniref:Bone morphogenetic protein 5-8 n=1 Tax=Hofstenia miamia TaxID=442651 RepID=A0A068CMB7_HOFMI|nr:bone morphogenetic protein 5-8 [Hofstenia miamia]